MEAVDVLDRVDPLDDRGLLDLSWQWQLYQDAVDLRVAIELIDEGEEGDLRGRVGQVARHGADADFLACPALVPHVDLGGRVAAHLDHGETGPPGAARERRLDLATDLVFDLRRQLAAIDRLRRHSDYRSSPLRGGHSRISSLRAWKLPLRRRFRDRGRGHPCGDFRGIASFGM